MREVRRGVALPDLDSLFQDGVAAGLPDKELLHRFVSSRDRCGELAFTTLVARHGPMVLGVCRRILRDSATADVAFQATFLVLAQGRFNSPGRFSRPVALRRECTSGPTIPVGRRAGRVELE